jgi:hypothetical protein
MSSNNPAPSAPTKKILPGQTSAPRPNQTAAYTSAFVLAVVLFVVFVMGHLPIPLFAGLRYYGFAMRYIAFPLLAYLLSACTNAIVQQMTCGHINASEIFLSAGYFMGPLYGGLLAGTSAYLRAPIASLGTPDERLRGILEFERSSDLVLAFGKAYWVFFGAFLGQVLAGAMAAVC